MPSLLVAGPSTTLLAGVALLALAGQLAARRLLLWGLLLALPGAALLAFSGPLPASLPLRWAVFVTVALAAPLTADLDRRLGGGALTAALLATAALGAYLTLPDTEEASLQLSLLAALALVARTAHDRRSWDGRLGAAASFALVGAYGWVATIGGRGRDGAVAGALAALGVLLVEPLLRRLPGLASRLERSSGGRRWAWALGVQLPAALLAARWAGLRETSGEAAWPATAVLLGVGVALALRAEGRARRRPPARRRRAP